MANVLKRSPKRERLILESLQQFPTYNRAAEAAGITTTTLRRWRDDDPDFDTAVHQAREAGGEALEDALIMRAIDGKDTTALIFALKSWRRDRYGDRQAHEISGADGQALTVVIAERGDGPA